MSNLADALPLLDQFYGRMPAMESDDLWSRCALLIISHGRSGKPINGSWMAETPLASVAETSRASAAIVATLLEANHQPAKAAGALVGVAKWWLRVSDVDGNPFEGSSLETLREKLRELPGVNLELADRLLLLGGRMAFPLDRGTQRIVCRHGWLDWQSEYEDWQSVLCRARDAPSELPQISWWFGKVAKEFCKPHPHCQGCPLEPLLSLHGPIEFTD